MCVASGESLIIFVLDETITGSLFKGVVRLNKDCKPVQDKTQPDKRLEANGSQHSVWLLSGAGRGTGQGC